MPTSFENYRLRQMARSRTHRLAVGGGECITIGRALLAEKCSLSSNDHGSLLDRLRVGEIKRIADDWRAGGVCDTIETGRRIFTAALPHLLKLPAVKRSGLPGHGDLGWFAAHYAPAFYAAKGGRAFFDRMAEDYETGRVEPPHPLRADDIAGVLGITMAERTRLSLKSIGAIDRSKQSQRERRNALKRERRRKAGGMSRAEYLEEAQRKRDEAAAAGVSIRTMQRRAKAAAQAAVASPGPINSEGIARKQPTVTTRPATEPRECQGLPREEGGLNGAPPVVWADPGGPDAPSPRLASLLGSPFAPVLEGAPC